MKSKINSVALILVWIGCFFFLGIYNSFGKNDLGDQFYFSINIFQQEDFKNIIVSNFKKGDMQNLSTYFSKEMVVGLDGSDEDVSAKTATVLLKDFFQKNPAKDFKALHNGQSKNGDSQYLIGDLKTTNGKSYRVYIGFQKNKITEITIK